jgi:hypothetical protein
LTLTSVCIQNSIKIGPPPCGTAASHLGCATTSTAVVVAHVPRDPSSRRRSRSHLTVVRNSRGRCRVHLRETLSCSCPLGSTAAATSPSCTPHGVAVACVPSGSDATTAPTSPLCVPQGDHRRALASRISRRERDHQIRRRALAPRIRRRARLSGGGAVTTGVAKTEP